MILNFDYTSIFLILLNVFVFVLFVFLIYVIFRQYKTSVRAEENIIKEEAYHKAIKMLDEAQQRSMEVINSSNQRAKEILQNVEFLTDDAKAHLGEEFEKMSHKQLKDMESVTKDLLSGYMNILDQEKQKGVETIRNISQTIEQEAVQELNEFKEVLAQETAGAENQLESIAATELEQSKARIQQYEQQKIAEINQEVKKLVVEVSKDLFGKSVDMETNEELVMAALERAKANGLFSS